MTGQPDHAALAQMTADIVSAFVSHHQIRPADVGHLIAVVGGRLATLGAEETQTGAAKPEPAVPVRRSVGRDHILCLVCGSPQRMLKRHLTVAHGLTPDQYRKQYGLKSDYPMVAPSYAQQRRELALEIGLGRPKKPARRRKTSGSPRRAGSGTPAAGRR